MRNAHALALEIEDKVNKLLSERDVLRAQVTKLMEALRPFAKAFPHQDEPDHWPMFGKPAGEGWATNGDARRAAAVIKEVENDKSS